MKGTCTFLCAFLLLLYTYMEMQACANCCLSRMCLFKVACSRFSLAKTLKERSGDSNLWIQHEIIDSLFSSNVGVRRMTKSSLKRLTKSLGNSMKYSPAQQRRYICRTQDVFSDMKEKGIIKDLQASLEEFEQEGKSFPAIWFWDDFLKHIMLPIKLFIASSRFGVWEVNQYAKVDFLLIVYELYDSSKEAPTSRRHG